MFGDLLSDELKAELARRAVEEDEFFKPETEYLRGEVGAAIGLLAAASGKTMREVAEHFVDTMGLADRVTAEIGAAAMKGGN